MALQDIYDLTFQAEELRQRVHGACISAAVDVLNEDAGTANHANRLAWAKAVLVAEPGNALIKHVYRFVLSNATVLAAGAEATDNDLQFVVNSIIGDADLLTALGYGA